MAEGGDQHRLVILCDHVQGDNIIMNLKKVRIQERERECVCARACEREREREREAFRYHTCFQRDCHSLELFL